MMRSRWVSFGRVNVRLAMHRYPTPLDGPASYSVLDGSDPESDYAMSYTIAEIELDENLKQFLKGIQPGKEPVFLRT